MLSDNGLEGYKACVSARTKVGTFLWVSKNAATAPHFFVGVRWEGGVGGPQGKFDFVGPSPFQVIGGQVVGPYAANPPKVIKSGQEITVEVQRDLAQDFQFSTSINENAPEERIFLPRYQPRPVKFVVRKSEFVASHSDFGPDGNEGANDDKYPEFDAGPNEQFLPVTAQVVGHRDGEHSALAILKAEPLRILWHVWAKTPTTDHGAWAGGYVSVIAATWT